MAIECDIPNDICKYEAHLIGPFTTRQIIFLIPGAILSIGGGYLLSKTMPLDLSIFVGICICMPFVLMGFVKVNNLPFAKFVKTIWRTLILAPKNRVYKTVNNFSYVFPEKKELTPKEKKQIEKKVYKSPNPQLKGYR